MKIMILDDVRLNILRLKEVVQTFGQVDGYQEIQPGLDALESAYLGGEPYDLLLLDITMPEMSGLDVLKRVTRMALTYRSERKTKVVMVTSHGERDIVMQAAQLGAVGYILRPFQPDRIRQEIQRLLEPEANSGRDSLGPSVP